MYLKSNCYISNYIKTVETFYRVNNAKVVLTETIKAKTVYKDRAPKPEELSQMLELADLREKFVVSALALGGFREECLSKLQYRHVKDDLEKNIIPIHIHVEAEITKGKYHDYDTFLGAEAVQYLKLYLEQRKKGYGNFPPETITDNSPLLRDSKKGQTPRGIGRLSIYQMIHRLYAKAGLLKHNGTRYDLRAHSLRKYFKTQLTSLGVQTDYIEYMMGHTIGTYHDIQSLGIDSLRAIYHSAGLSIRPKTRVNKLDTLKEVARALGINPEQTLTKEALAQGAITYNDTVELENNQLTVLMRQIANLIKAEVNK